MEHMKSIEIKDERDYAIRKGKILERFTPEFFSRYKHSGLFRNVYETMIRTDDPFTIIERLIEANEKIMKDLHEMMPYVSPNYHLSKSKSSPIQSETEVSEG